jgi:hypothetical protein
MFCFLSLSWIKIFPKREHFAYQATQVTEKEIFILQSRCETTTFNRPTGILLLFGQIFTNHEQRQSWSKGYLRHQYESEQHRIRKA